eukprot:TRINITY_DN1609_c1_g1_i2.p2 TRINITY_DN1609_c1_g1~~TRINITY_DN1609_c1_g1_i2.p2  ORF type:complete len:604 (+),score=243.20 TRINITY_DN1609_c1_g1_i2:139-1812(+)
MAAEYERLWKEAQAHGEVEHWKLQMCVLARMIPLARKLGGSREAPLWSNLGMAYQKLGNHTKALESFEKYRDACAELGDQRRVALALARMAEAAEAGGDGERAAALRSEAESLKAEAAAKKARDRAAAIGTTGPPGSDAAKAASVAAAVQRMTQDRSDQSPPPAPAPAPAPAAAPAPAPAPAAAPAADADAPAAAPTAPAPDADAAPAAADEADSSSASEEAAQGGGGGGGGKRDKKKKQGKRKRERVKRQTARQERSVVQAIDDLERQVRSEEDLQVITSTLMHHVRSVHAFPDERKYRVVSSQSKTFRTKLACYTAALELLQMLGFQKHSSGDWELPAGARLDRESCELLELYHSGVNDSTTRAPVSLEHMVRGTDDVPAPRKKERKQRKDEQLPADEATDDGYDSGAERKRRDLESKFEGLWKKAFSLGREDEHEQYVTVLEAMLPIACSLNDVSKEAQVRSCLGVAYREMARYDLALAQFTRALKINETAGDIRKTLATVKHVGETHQAAQDYPAALRVYKQFLMLSDGDRRMHPERRLEVEANIVACVRRYF